jgi:hypothetical protein
MMAELPTCVNLAGKVERRKSAGKGCTELVVVLTMTYFKFTQLAVKPACSTE